MAYLIKIARILGKWMEREWPSLWSEDHEGVDINQWLGEADSDEKVIRL